MATTPNFLENFALSRSFALGKNFSLVAKKEISHLTPSPILRASESLATALLQTLGVILLFVLLLQLLAPWPSRPSFQNHTWEKTFPSSTSHLEKTTYAYDAASGSSLYCNGDPVNGLDPDGRCVEGMNAGWANGNGQFAATYDSSQASSTFAYGLGWTVGGALGTINGMAASLTTRPLAAMGQGFNEVTDFAEENLNLAPGSLTAATFMFAPLAVAGEVAKAETVTKVAAENPIIVVGEGMQKVNAFSQEMAEQGISTRTYPAINMNRPINPNVYGSLKSLNANRSWLDYWAKGKGADVIDIGPQPGRSISSPYYNMEVQNLYLWEQANKINPVIRFDPGY